MRLDEFTDTASSTDKQSVATPLAGDAEIKKKIGADQPIPGYKYDAAKDQAILDKLEKQDRVRQKLPLGRLKPNKAPKPSAGTGS
jgi:hypothetical protein